MDEEHRKYERHIPRILMRQLTASFCTLPSLSSASFQPTIARFQAALLFVDISGFTVLSQKLDVDHLRLFINAYFTKLINIVHKYGGDVCKFAGDALFIIWHVDENSESVNAHAAYCIQQAILCSLEINAKCSDYEVKLIAKHSKSRVVTKLLFEHASSKPHSNHAVGSSTSPGTSNTISKGFAGGAPQNSLSYLNVHSGLSIGVMAGIDVGHDGRCEYLLMGGPLNDVAVAESEAGKGELVISPVAHSLLHGNVSTAQLNAGDKCSCGCLLTPKGYFKLTDNIASLSANVDQLGNPDLPSTDSQLSLAIPPDLSPRPQPKSFFTNLGTNRDHLLQLANTWTHCRQNMAAIEIQIQSQIAQHVHYVARALSSNTSESNNQNGSNYVDNHDGTSVDSEPTHGQVESDDDTLLDSCMVHFEDSNLKQTPLPSSSLGAAEVDEETKLQQPRRTLRDKYHALYAESAQNDSFLLAEKREVVVLFINLGLSNKEIVSFAPMTGVNKRRQEGDSSDVNDIQRVFSFLERNAVEMEDDRAVLEQFQSCFEIMVSELHRGQGHLRQFIVDDKGTVAIGTFGLRGSVSADNASAAVDAANRILQGLEALNVSASIGITSGKVYCGLVGCPERHEYAVMGPSVNLSARLMGKASSGSILCDVQIQQRDRKHRFQGLGEIQAKGYAEPVAIFQPLFRTRALSLNMQSASLMVSLRKGLTLRDLNMHVDVSHNEDQTLQHETSSSALSTIVSPRGYARNQDHRTLSHEDDVYLFGRDMEIAQLHAHLQTLVTNASALRSVLLGFSLSPLSSRPVFLTQMQSRLVLVSGKNGLGKHFFVHAICKRLLRHKHDRLWNVQVLRTEQAHRKNVSEPLSPWKAVLWQACVDHGHQLQLQERHRQRLQQQKEDEFQKRTSDEDKVNSHSMSRTSSVQGVTSQAGGSRLSPHSSSLGLKGLRSLLAQLSVDLCDLGPLLHNFLPVSANSMPENAQTRVLKGRSRLQKTSDLISALLCKYQQIRDKVVVVDMGNLQLLDDLSSSLLDSLWRISTGFVLIAFNFSSSFTFAQTSTSQKSVLDVPNIELKEIDYVSTSQLVVHILKHSLRNFDGRFSSNKHSSAQAESEGVTEEVEVQDEVLLEIFRQSGGNPVYASELALACGDYVRNRHVHHHQEKQLRRTSSSTNVLSSSVVSSELILLLRSSSSLKAIEEVICFRFDQVSICGQILLKAASVATANGSYVTPQILAHLLQGTPGFDNSSADDAKSNSNEDAESSDASYGGNSSGRGRKLRREAQHHRQHKRHVLARVFEIFARELFDQELFLVHVEAFGVSESSSFRSSKTDSATVETENEEASMEEKDRKDDEFAEELQWNFKADLEQKVIYGLMMEEQTAHLHHRMASYLEGQRTSRSVTTVASTVAAAGSIAVSSFASAAVASEEVSAAQWFEEAFHCERAGLYASAMTAYFQSGMCLDALGALQESRFHLLLAYQMLSRLRADTASLHKSKDDYDENNSGSFDLSSQLGDLLMSKVRLNTTNNKAVNSNATLGTSHSKSNLNSHHGMPRNNSTGIMLSRQQSRQASFVLLEPANATGNSSNASSHKSKSAIHQDNNKLQVYMTFQGDKYLLEIGIQVLLRLAQSCLTLDNDANVTAKIYEEALELMTAIQPAGLLLGQRQMSSKRTLEMFTYAETDDENAAEDCSTIKNTRNNTTTNTHNTPNATTNSGANSTAPSSATNPNAMYITRAELDRFNLRDPSICFPVLSGIIVLYHTKKLADDKFMSKEKRACELFLAIARTNKQLYLSHYAMGLTFLRNIYTELGLVDEGASLIDEAKGLYVYKVHSSEIIRVYGADRMPRVFAVNLQVLILLNDQVRIAVYETMLDELFDQIGHLHTLAQLVMPLCAAFVARGNHQNFQLLDDKEKADSDNSDANNDVSTSARGDFKQRALSYFERYLDLEATQKGIAAFSHFKDVNPLLHIWLQLEVRTNDRQLRHLSRSDALRWAEAGDKAERVEVSQELLDKLHNRVYLKFPIASRSFVHTALDFFGCSLEYVCARILFLHYLQGASQEVSKEVSKEEGVSQPVRCGKDHLRKALEYIDYHLLCVQEDANFVFGRAQTLFLQMQILRALEAEGEDSSEEVITGLANICLQLASKHNYAFIRHMVKAFLLSCASTDAYSALLQQINAENEEVPLSQSELDRLWRE